MTRGYFRFPAVFKNQVVFTSEDDLWEVPLDGGGARRLTAGRGSALYPCFSPDGRQLAFSSAEEGHNEVYVMGNASEEVKRQASVVTDSNDDEGFAKAVERFLLKTAD